MTADGSSHTGRPRAIIFDWDNTLVDTWPVIHDALNTTLAAFDHTPWSLAETKQRVRKSVRDRFPSLFGDKWEDAREVFYHRYNEIHMRDLQPIAGVADMLAHFAQSEIYLAVVSNKRGDFLRAEAEHLGWTGHFGAIVGANDAPRDKPARDPVDMALRPAGLSPATSVWFAGDADIDMECARNTGCTGVWVGGQDSLDAAGFEGLALLQFEDCMALCKYVDKL